MIKIYLLIAVLVGWSVFVWTAATSVNRVNELHHQISAFEDNEKLNTSLIEKLTAENIKIEELTLDAVKNIKIDQPSCIVPGSVGELFNRIGEG